MTIDEAFDHVMFTVQELTNSGIATHVERCPSRDISETVHEYSGPENLPVEKWVDVNFYPENAKETIKIFDAALGLSWLGIAFDNGGRKGHREWNIDWSFHLSPGPNSELEQIRGECEDMIEADEE